MRINIQVRRVVILSIVLSIISNLTIAQQSILLKLYTTFLISCERNLYSDAYLKSENAFFDSEFKKLSPEKQLTFKSELIKTNTMLSIENKRAIQAKDWNPSELSSKVTCNFIFHGMTLGSEPIIKALDAMDAKEISDMKGILKLLGYNTNVTSEINASTKNLIDEFLNEDCFTNERRICWGTDLSYRVRKKMYLDTYLKIRFGKALPSPSKIFLKERNGELKEVTLEELNKKMEEAENEGCHIKEMCSNEKERSVSGEMECSNGFSFKISSNGNSFAISFKSFGIEYDNGKLKVSLEFP
ncbi:hypothetical protein [Pollutibacter soli]|uniref:hypothetical protein n=1 Tax=Pollutibacter soli TaxID=3034157 RepID=UPI003013451F